jgi:hypothetical protein
MQCRATAVSDIFTVIIKERTLPELQGHVFHTELKDQLKVPELLDSVNIYSNIDVYVCGEIFTKVSKNVYILPPFVLGVHLSVRFPAAPHCYAAALPIRTSSGIRTRVRVFVLLATMTALLQF